MLFNRKLSLHGDPRTILVKLFKRTIGILFPLLLLSPAIATALPQGFQKELILSGVDQPVYLAQLPDSRMLLLSKVGTVYIFDPSSVPAQASVYLTLPDVDSASERGLTSIAVDPDFASSGSIYIFYSHAPSKRFRISRFTHQGNTADLASEQVIWQDNENVRDCCHYGGGLQFGPDGKLYLTTGEEFDGPQSQDLTRAGGKIIRINKDGSAPSDNPFADGPGGNLDEIWAYGLRNPYRAHWDLIKQRLYISEVGGNVQETAREDIHLGRAGANYGWPYCEGECTDETYDPPIFSYSHSGSTPSGGAVTAGTVYRGDLYPSLYNEVFFFADYAQGFIRYLSFNSQGDVTGDFGFASRDDGVIAPVHVILGEDGALYYVDYYLGSVSRITYSSGNQAPEISSLDVSPGSGPAPLTVTFSAVATDFEGDPLTYTWHLGNGTTVTGPSIQYTYEQNGSYSVYLEVSDGDRSVISSPTSIQVGFKPEITIDSPADGMLFRAGDTINFSGSAYDNDGILVDESFEWNIDFLHNAHTHPVLSGYNSANGQLEINTKGHDYHDATGYRLKLKVTDQDGLSSTSQVSIYPDKVDLNFVSVPAGLPVFIDGVQHTAPFVYDSVIDFNHVISVPMAHCVGDVAYEFVSWSNGQNSTYNLPVPDTDTTYEAVFQAVGSCGSFPTDGLVLSLSGDIGVQTTDGVVTDWLDQSGQGNHLTGTGTPILQQDALNEHDAVVFDGTSAAMMRIGDISGLPVASSNRTIIAVVNYFGVGMGGISYGDTGCGHTFGLVVDSAGDLLLQGWCNDFPSDSRASGSGWFTHSVVLEGNIYRHFVDGIEVDSGTYEFDTLANKIVIGSEIDGTPHVDMAVAGVYIYDRALSNFELGNAHGYINKTYFSVPDGVSPIAADDNASLVQGGNAILDVLANDSDSDSTLLPSSIDITRQPQFGSAVINYVDGTISYTHDGTANFQDSFDYTVSDDQYLVSNNATVNLVISEAQSSIEILSPSQGQTINDTQVTIDVSVVGDDFDHIEVSIDGQSPIDLSPSADTYTFTGVDAGSRTITVQLVNANHQSLVTPNASDSATITVENNGVPHAPETENDMVALSIGETVTIMVLENDSDANDDLDISSVEILTQPSLGSVSVDTQGVVTYTHDQIAIGSDSFTYRVYDLTGLASNEATVSVTVTGNGPAVSTSGLVLRLEADEGVASTEGTVTLWQDLSGQGNDLNEVSGDPQLEQNTLNGHAVISFDGSEDEMRRSADFSNLPAGSADRTVVMVANYRSVGYGGFAYGNNACGNTFGLGVTNTGNLFVQRWCADYKSETPGTGAGWMIQAATVSGNTMTHYLNGDVIATGANGFDTLIDRMVLGAEIDGTPTLDMQVAAIY
uniref:PQQ-dependent sugar dehydrogenase n=1 Tax=Microbulbifer mangrovi TaxID=927787 RepID=UPI00117DBFD9